MTIRCRPLFAALTTLALVPACSDDNTDSAAPFESSLEADSTVEELEDAEAEQLCNELNEYRANYLSEGEVQRLTCILAAAFAHELPVGDMSPTEACSMAFDECMSEDLGSDPGSATDESSCGPTALDGCSMTVGELENCFNESAQDIRAAIAEFSCDSWDETAEIMPSPECHEASESCGMVSFF